MYDWYTAPLPGPMPGFARTLLVRRSKTDRELETYIVHAPVGTPREKMAEIAGTRWTVETSFREAKNEVGMDQYEVRTYNAWYKHITFCMLAIAMLTVLSADSGDGLSLQQHDPAGTSLDDFKKKTLFARLSSPTSAKSSIPATVASAPSPATMSTAGSNGAKITRFPPYGTTGTIPPVYNAL